MNESPIASNPTFDRKKFKEIKARHADLVESHGHDIENNRFLRLPGVVIAESIWLAKQLDILLKLVPTEDVAAAA